MNKTSVLAVVCTFFSLQSSMVFAHEGHGQWASFAHSYEHMLLPVCIAFVVVTALFVKKAWNQRVR